MDNGFADQAMSQVISVKTRIADLLTVAVLASLASATITLLWQQPFIAASLILPLPVVLSIRLGDTGRGIVMAAAGAAIGPATEVACSAGGLWNYSDTGGLPFVPPWLFPLWACFPAALWLVVRASVAENVFYPARWRRDLAVSLSGIAIHISIFLAFGSRTLMALAIGAVMVLAVKQILPGRATPVVMLAGGIIGPLCEAGPLAAGAWSYSNPDYFGMPGWLPLAYAIFALLVARAAAALGSGINHARSPIAWKKFIRREC